MTIDDKEPLSERSQTDESLRVERETADKGLGERVAAIEETADAVVCRARVRADAVLAASRAKTDRRSKDAPRVTQVPDSLARERLLEDRVVRQERAGADETLRVERATQAASLSVEREETDKDLLTERARSDGALETRDEFLGIVSHDLRNMLNAVVGFAALIEGEASQENRITQVQAYAQRIQRSGGRMSRLIGDLVDVASIEAGTLGVTTEVGDPTRVVTEALENLSAQAASSGVALLEEIVPPSPLVELDPARILQVLTNLLSNALKFTPAGGRIVVRVERIRDDVRFSVSDTGSGIPKDKLEAVFGRFVQVAKNDRRGLGLGLYISKCIVQGHGGRIWAESRLGEGSTVSFTIPVTSHASPGP